MQLRTTKEAAKEAGCSYTQLQSALFNEKLKEPATRVGSHRLFSPKEIETIRKYFAERKAEGRLK